MPDKIMRRKSHISYASSNLIRVLPCLFARENLLLALCSERVRDLDTDDAEKGKKKEESGGQHR